MLGIRFERYSDYTDGLPFVLRNNLVRTPFICSREQNWHDAPELQLCTGGEGTLLIDGISYPFLPGDMAAVSPGKIHYTGTDTRLEYAALIISSEFCRRMGIDCDLLHFTSHFRDTVLEVKFKEFCEVYSGDSIWRVARMNTLLMEILLRLAENYSTPLGSSQLQSGRVETVKAAIHYIREHYAQKLCLDDIAQAVCADKYALCRDFRRFTGETIITYTNHYRCVMASRAINSGFSVAEAAQMSGFGSASFFTHTFKRYMGILPSHADKIQLN